MRELGVLIDYALFGPLAQMRYTEPLATLDADVLVAVPAQDRLNVLAPIHAFCRARGYNAERDAARVGASPVQFVPVFSVLTAHALERADTADFEGVPLRVVTACHRASSR